MSGRPYTRDECRHIRKWAGIKTTTEIAKDIGRTRAGVAQKANSMGVSLIQRGENHYNAKMTDNDADLIINLDSLGYKPKQIHARLPHITITSIYDLLECNTWRHK